MNYNNGDNILPKLLFIYNQNKFEFLSDSLDSKGIITSINQIINKNENIKENIEKKEVNQYIFNYDINNQNFATIITNKYLDNLSFTLYNERFTEITPRKDYSFTIKIEIITTKDTSTTDEILKQILELKKLKLISK